jgi:WD40 repeat protein
MDPFGQLFVLACRPFVDPARLDRDSSERLGQALARAGPAVWKILEVVLAGRPFWDGCRVFLPADELRVLKEKVSRLRSEALPAGRDEEGLRQSCLRELHAAVESGLLTGPLPDLARLSGALADLGRGAVSSSPLMGEGEDATIGLLSEAEQHCARQLAESLQAVGFPGLAHMTRPGPGGQVPILVAAVRYCLAQQIGAEPELAARLRGWSWPASGPREEALAAVAQTLAVHGRALQEWLAEEAAVSAPKAVHAHASSASGSAPKEGAAEAEAGRTPGDSPSGVSQGFNSGQPAPPPPAPPLTGRQRLWALLLPLLAMLVPVVIVLWLVYHHLVSEVRQFTGHEELVTSAVFSPDGKLLLSGSGDCTARLWDVQTGKELRRFQLPEDDKHSHKGDIYSVAFSPDGRLAVTGGNDTLRLWDVATGKQLHRFDTPTNWVLCVAFSRDGKQIASTSKADRFVRLWDVASGKQVGMIKEYKRSVDAVVYSPDGKTLAATDDTAVSIWDVSDLTKPKRLQLLEGHKGRVTSLAYSADGRFLVSGSEDRTARVWDVQVGREVTVLEGHAAPIIAVAFSPDGRTIATGSLGPQVQPLKKGTLVLSEPRPLRLWNAANGRESAHFDRTDEPAPVWAVAFSPDGRYLLSTGQDKKIHLWQVP